MMSKVHGLEQGGEVTNPCLIAARLVGECLGGIRNDCKVVRDAILWY